MQIENYYHYSFLQKLIVFTVNEHENICIAGLNRQAGYVTEDRTLKGFCRWKIEAKKPYIYTASFAWNINQLLLLRQDLVNGIWSLVFVTTYNGHACLQLCAVMKGKTFI